MHGALLLKEGIMLSRLSLSSYFYLFWGNEMIYLRAGNFLMVFSFFSFCFLLNSAHQLYYTVKVAVNYKTMKALP